MTKHRAARAANAGRDFESSVTTLAKSNTPTAPAQDIPTLDTKAPRCVDWGVATEILRILHRQKKLDAFLEDWRNGTCAFTMEPPEAIDVIAKLIARYDEAEVRPLKWPAAPSDEQMKDADEWVGECVAEARDEQAAAKRQRGVRNVMNHVLVRAGDEPAPSKINPVYLQRSKFSLEQLAERLTNTMARHQAEHGEFRHEWLDHKSKRYINNNDGGISNKQIQIMANLIEGRQQQRRFDDNWSIVTNWLAQRSEVAP